MIKMTHLLPYDKAVRNGKPVPIFDYTDGKGGIQISWKKLNKQIPRYYSTDKGGGKAPRTVTFGHKMKNGETPHGAEVQYDGKGGKVIWAHRNH